MWFYTDTIIYNVMVINNDTNTTTTATTTTTAATATTTPTPTPTTTTTPTKGNINKNYRNKHDSNNAPFYSIQAFVQHHFCSPPLRSEELVSEPRSKGVGYRGTTLVGRDGSWGVRGATAGDRLCACRSTWREPQAGSDISIVDGLRKKGVTLTCTNWLNGWGF